MELCAQDTTIFAAYKKMYEYLIVLHDTLLPAMRSG
jgi:hypothetical protein